MAKGRGRVDTGGLDRGFRFKFPRAKNVYYTVFLHRMIFDDSYLFLQFGNFFIELNVLIVVFRHEI